MVIVMIEKFKKVLKNEKVLKSGAAILCFIFALIMISTKDFKNVKNKKNENNLSQQLEEMGKNYYENYYYDQLGTTMEEIKESIKQYENSGVKIDLYNLVNFMDEYKDKMEEFVNSETDEKCDENNTMIIIYPENPYGKEDYRTEVVLDCGFKNI